MSGTPPTHGRSMSPPRTTSCFKGPTRVHKSGRRVGSTSRIHNLGPRVGSTSWATSWVHKSGPGVGFHESSTQVGSTGWDHELGPWVGFIIQVHNSGPQVGSTSWVNELGPEVKGGLRTPLIRKNAGSMLYWPPCAYGMTLFHATPPSWE